MSYKKSLGELNNEQYEAALCMSDCMVIACPGSGKTKMLATKAARLMEEGDGIVGAVTFSKDSAIELQQRIRAMSSVASKNLKVGTFHSLAFKQLSSQCDIVSEGQRIQYVRSAIEELEIEVQLKDALILIDTMKSKGETGDENEPSGRLYRHYQKQLSLNRQIDFSDMVVNAVIGMETGRITPYPFKYLLVDEFQDTDPMQSRWIMAHRKAGAILTVVGDDDQSIYAFRAAMGFNGMQSFLLQTNARQVVLGKNYRCRSEILGIADNLIRNNKNRIPKDLVAAKGGGGHVKSKLFVSPDLEAEFIVDDINDDCKLSNAILARNNRDLDIVESVLRSAGKPYYRPADKSLFSYSEVAMFFGLIELVAGVKEDVGLDAIFRFVNMADIDREAIHSMKIKNLKKLSKSELVSAGVSEQGASTYRNFATIFDEWKKIHARGSLSLMINGVSEWLMEKLPTKNEVTRRVIYSAALALDRLNGDIASRIRFLRENRNNEPAENAIILSTLHGSKGLEWDRVWIIRAEASICPSDKSPIEEERRLFYVGATRAKESLTISMTTKNPTSPFVGEMDLSLLSSARD